MQILIYLIAGSLIGFVDYFYFERDNGILSLIKKVTRSVIVFNIVSLSILKFIMKKPYVFSPSIYTTIFSIKYLMLTLLFGAIYLFVKGVLIRKLVL